MSNDKNPGLIILKIYTSIIYLISIFLFYLAYLLPTASYTISSPIETVGFVTAGIGAIVGFVAIPFSGVVIISIARINRKRLLISATIVLALSVFYIFEALSWYTYWDQQEYLPTIEYGFSITIYSIVGQIIVFPLLIAISFF